MTNKQLPPDQEFIVESKAKSLHDELVNAGLSHAEELSDRGVGTGIDHAQEDTHNKSNKDLFSAPEATETSKHSFKMSRGWSDDHHDYAKNFMRGIHHRLGHLGFHHIAGEEPNFRKGIPQSQVNRYKKDGKTVVVSHDLGKYYNGDTYQDEPANVELKVHDERYVKESLDERVIKGRAYGNTDREEDDENDEQKYATKFDTDALAQSMGLVAKQHTPSKVRLHKIKTSGTNEEIKESIISDLRSMMTSKVYESSDAIKSGDEVIHNGRRSYALGVYPHAGEIKLLSTGNQPEDEVEKYNPKNPAHATLEKPEPLSARHKSEYGIK